MAKTAIQTMSPDKAEAEASNRADTQPSVSEIQSETSAWLRLMDTALSWVFIAGLFVWVLVGRLFGSKNG